MRISGLIFTLSVCAWAVGNPASAAVDSSGSFSHLVEIDLPEGTNGVRPDLSLIYSSGGGSGMLGMGWSLSGLPTITRMNYGNGVNYDGADTYAGLSGRLVSVAPGVYHSAAEDWAKYVPTGTCGDGPCSWVMYDGQGNTLEFGTTTDSRIEKVGSASVRVWAINRFTDPNGNSYEVTYSEDTINGDYYPSVVTYTKGTGISTFRTVELAYEARTDVISSYADNALETMDQRLKWITVKSAGVLVRKYRLDYATGASTGRSRLTTVQEYGSDGTSTLPAQTFGWHEDPNVISSSAGYSQSTDFARGIAGSHTAGNGTQYADLNGDGKTDIIQLFCGCNGTVPSSQKIYLNTGSGLSYSASYSTGLSDLFFEGCVNGSTDSYDMGTRLEDINGDGRPDLIQLFNAANAPMGWYGYATVKRVYLNTGTNFVYDAGFSGSLPSSFFAMGVSGTGTVSVGTQLADLNGDGKTDIVQSYSGCTALGYPGQHVYLNTGTGFGPDNASYSSAMVSAALLFEGCNNGVYATYDMGTRLADVNGDGRPDLVQLFNAANAPMGWYGGAPQKRVYLNTGGGFAYSAAYTATLPSTYFTMGVGGWGTVGLGTQLTDLNGDGKVDLVQSYCGCNTLGYPGQHVYLNTGAGFGADVASFDSSMSSAGIFFSGCNHGTYDTLDMGGRLADVNGDGRPDFVLLFYAPNSPMGWYGGAPIKRVYLNNGTSFVYNAGYTSGVTAMDAYFAGGVSGTTTAGMGTELVDVNGDGKVDVLQYFNAAGAPYGWYGGVERLSYYQSGGTDSLPPDVLISIANGLGSTTTVAYVPANQVSGAVCPSTSTAGCSGANLANGIASGGGLLVTAVSTTDGRGATYSKSYAYFNRRTFPGTIPNQASLGFEWFKETDDQTGISNTTYFRQDKPFHGQVKRMEERTGAGLLISASDEGTQTAFTCSETGCVAGTADPIQIRSGGKTAYDYNVGTLLSYATVTPTYDAYGNTTQRTRTTYTPTATVIRTNYDYASFINQASSPRAIGLQYESKECGDTACATLLGFDRKYFDALPLGSVGARLLVTKKEAFVDGTVSAPIMGVDTAQYDAYGNVTSETAANGLVTSVVYDSTFFAYPTSTTAPGNLTTTKAYDTRFDVATTTTSPDGASIVVTLDVFGRPTTVETKNGVTVLRKSGSSYSMGGVPDGNWTRNCNYYGAGFSAALCSKTYQDGLGRTYRAEQDGVTATGLAATILSDTQFDTAGRPYRTSEPYYAGGTPTYWTTQAYDSAGQVTSITYPNSGVTTIVYNDQPLVAGSYSMKSSTDPMGKLTRQWYDDRGAVVRVEEGSPALVGTYLYDAKGLLTSVTDPRSNVTTLAYDAGGRRISLTTVDSGTTTTTYNLTPGTPNFMTVKTETVSSPNTATGTLTRTMTYDPLGRPTGQTVSDASATSVTRYEETTYSNWKGRITSKEQTEGGYTTTKTFAYNILGEVTDSYRIVKQGATTLFTAHDRLSYDEMGRPYQRTYPDGSVVTQAFDVGGNIANVVVDGVTFATFSNYDVRTKVGTVTLANGVTTGYTYAPNTGALATLVTRKGTTSLVDEAYTFDLAGNVTGVTDNRTPSLTTSYSYDSYHRLSRAQRNSGQIFNYTFDNAGNLTKKATLNSVGVLSDLLLTVNATNNRVTSDGASSYTYSAAGNRVGKGAAGIAYATCPAGSTCYDYNNANMLRGVKNGSSVVLKNYFDADQNRVVKVYTKADGTTVTTYYLSEGFEIRETRSAQGALLDSKTTKYIMGIDHQKLASITAAGETLVAFNLRNLSNNHYALAGMISTDSLKGVALKINHWVAAVVTDARVRSRVPSLAGALCVLALLALLFRRATRARGTVERKARAFRPALVLLAVMIMLNCTGDGGLSSDGSTFNGMLYGGQSALMSGDTSMGLPVGTYFYHADRLGSSSSVTDATGAETTRVVYAPYGEVDQGYSTGQDIVTFKFTGQEYDPESSLYNYDARFYDARLGTFTSADSLVPDGLSTQAFNRYMYVKGNPVTYTDPTGHYWVKRSWSTTRHWTTKAVRMVPVTAYETQTRWVDYKCFGGSMTCHRKEHFRVSITVMAPQHYTISHSQTRHHASLRWVDESAQCSRVDPATWAQRRKEAERKYGKAFVKDACGSTATCNNVVNHTMDQKRVLHPPKGGKHPGVFEAGGVLHHIMERMFGKEKPGSFMWKLGNGHDGFNEAHMAHDKTLRHHQSLKSLVNQATAVEYTLVALGAGHHDAGHRAVGALGRAVVHGTLQVGLNAGHVQNFANTVTFGHATTLEKALFHFSPAGQAVRAIEMVGGVAKGAGHIFHKACGWVHICH